MLIINSVFKKRHQHQQEIEDKPRQVQQEESWKQSKKTPNQ